MTYKVEFRPSGGGGGGFINPDLALYIYSIHSHSTICPLPLNRSLDDAVGFLKVELLEEQRNPLSAWRFGITEISSEVKNVWLKGVQISTYFRYSIWHTYIYIYILLVLNNKI